MSRGLELLCETRELVARGWSQGADARDGAGMPVDAWAPTAERWSLLGALVAVLEREATAHGEIPLADVAAALSALAQLIEMDSLELWNDAPGRGQAEVLGVVDAASANYVPPPPMLRAP